MVDIAAHYERPLSDLGNVRLLPRVGEDNVLVHFDRQDRAQPTRLYEDIRDAALKWGARTLVLDSLHDLFGGNEISRTHARQFIGYLRQLALELDGAVVLTAHPSVAGMSTGTGTSGSTAWSNAVRSRLYLTRPTDDDTDDNLRTLKTMKQNYGVRQDGLELRWESGIFVRTAPIGGDPFREAEAAFLNCLDKAVEEGRRVSASPNSGTFAPKVFVRMPQARKLSADKLRRAMDALFAASEIQVIEHRKPNRHTVEVIARVKAPGPS